MRCVDVVNKCLSNLQARHDLNAFVRTYEAAAIQRAKIIDEKLAQGKAGQLAGLVVGLKDMLCYKDHPVEACSKMLKGFVAQFSATAVERLLAEDAIIIGHQNCDEFAMGSSNETSIYGPVHNPIDTNRVPGGSSGGCASGVRTGMCHASLGTDTGGSVRQPGAYCGIVALKPTYGLISRYGLIAYASSFDTIGIMSHTVHDCATVLEVIAGADGHDSTTANHPVPPYAQYVHGDPSPKKIALIKESLTRTDLQQEVHDHTRNMLQLLRQAGHTVTEVSFPWLTYVLPTYYLLTAAEASTNLTRFDGTRYGYRYAQSNNLQDMYTQTRSQGFGQEVKRRILLGKCVLSTSYQGAYYVKAQQVRRLIKEALEAILEQHDLLALPTTSTTAFKLGTYDKDPTAMYMTDRYTVIASLAGLPAISIPNGVDYNQMPIGFQFIGPAFSETSLLAAAAQAHALVT